MVGNKIPKTSGIFDDIDHPQSQWVTYWAERIGPLVDLISQFSCCVPFGAIQKNHMLFFEYFKIGCMYLEIYILSERYEVGLCWLSFPAPLHQLWQSL